MRMQLAIDVSKIGIIVGTPQFLSAALTTNEGDVSKRQVVATVQRRTE
jgi:hypothetical protein